MPSYVCDSCKTLIKEGPFWLMLPEDASKALLVCGNCRYPNLDLFRDGAVQESKGPSN